MKKTLFVGAILALSLTGTIAADTTSFKIQDFIPQRFKDFQWKLDGNASTGKSYTHDQDDHNRDNTANQFKGAIQGGTNFDYRFRSIPHYLTVSGNFVLLYDRYEKTYEWDTWNISDYYSGTYGRDESSRDLINIKQTLSIDAGKYVYRDIFMSGVVTANLSYSNTETNSFRKTTYDGLVDSVHYYTYTRLDGGSSGDSRTNSISLEIGPGFGRLYEGWYASTAMYIVEELRSHQLLLREPTNDEMLTLCDVIYQTRLKHAVDARLRRIEIFDEIFGYLKTAGLMDDAGHYSYLLIQDVWDYFPRKSRSFGMNARIAVGGRYSYSSRQSSGDYETKTTERAFLLSDGGNVLYDLYYDSHEDGYAYSRTNARDIYLAASFTYAIPLSRRWQLDAAAAAKCYLDSYSNQYDYNSYYVREDSAGQISRESSNVRYVSYDGQYDVSFSASGTYIMNSRTQLVLGSTFKVREYSRDEKCYSDDRICYYTDSEHRADFTGSLSALLEYRLAIPTTLTVQAVQHWGENEGEFPAYDYGHSYSLSVAISHYLY